MRVPAWPSGHVAFDGEVFEFGAGELERVPIENVRKIEVKPPRRGRFNLQFEYQAGLSNNKTGAWIEEQHEAELTELVASVKAAIGG